MASNAAAGSTEPGAAEPGAMEPGARLEADVEALLRLGVTMAKLEELYGASLVRSVAMGVVKSSGSEATGRLTVGGQLLQRSLSSKKDALQDQGFVDSMLASLQQDPDTMLMDPLMLVPLKDPVVLSSGFVVDRETAFPDGSTRLRFQHCPFSRQPLKPDAYPLVFLRDKVKAWKLDRLKQAVAMAEELVSSGQTCPAADPGRVDRVFEIAEQFMDEVGDATYIHVARRLAEAQRKSAAAKTPGQILRIHQRLSRVLGGEDLAAHVAEAMVEFSAEAQRHLDAGDAATAASWLGDDVQGWLEQPDIRPFWAAAGGYRAWLELQLKVSGARADDGATRRWRRAVRSALGLVRVGPGVDVQHEGPPLNPRPGSDWFLEVAFAADVLSSPSYRNSVFSLHGSGTGWEVRVCQDRGIELVWTTEGYGHNEYKCGRGGAEDCVGQWVHVGVCFDQGRSEHTIFVNGQPTPPHGVRGAFVPAPGPARLGGNPVWRDRQITGRVALARVDHELPAAPGEPLARHMLALAQERLGQLPPGPEDGRRGPGRGPRSSSSSDADSGPDGDSDYSPGLRESDF